MTDTKLLKDKIRESGLKVYFVAASMGLTYQGLKNKIEGRNQFTAAEIYSMSELLNLSSEERDSIFFASM